MAFDVPGASRRSSAAPAKGFCPRAGSCGPGRRPSRSRSACWTTCGRCAPPAVPTGAGRCSSRTGGPLPATTTAEPSRPLPLPGRDAQRPDLRGGLLGRGVHPDFQPLDGELKVREHWSASGFAHTDLDPLRQQDRIAKVALIGMRASTRIDATARFAQELAYHVTLVRDAIAAFGPEEMTATFEINAPTYAHVVGTADEFTGALRPTGTGSWTAHLRAGS
ncbi:isochorismatase family protein [Streptomyces sp. NPDC096153]|uniref:isochorismatase family protein n=1 Tax=Streptomyces sp. NPDC096153 TaxID=3155548 RepID=UPI003320EA5C